MLVAVHLEHLFFSLIQNGHFCRWAGLFQAMPHGLRALPFVALLFFSIATFRRERHVEDPTWHRFTSPVQRWFACHNDKGGACESILQKCSLVLMCCILFALGSLQVGCEHRSDKAPGQELFLFTIPSSQNLHVSSARPFWHNLEWSATSSLRWSGYPDLKCLFLFKSTFHSRSQQSSAPAPRSPWRASRPSHPPDSGAGPWARGNKNFA